MTGGSRNHGGYAPAQQVIEIPPDVSSVQITVGTRSQTVPLPPGCRQLVLTLSGAGGRGGEILGGSTNGGDGSTVILGGSWGGAGPALRSGQGGQGMPTEKLKG